MGSSCGVRAEGAGLRARDEDLTCVTVQSSTGKEGCIQEEGHDVGILPKMSSPTCDYDA